jgi:hypothetical protein
MQTVTLDEALDFVEHLPSKDLETFMEVLKSRQNEHWREEVRLAGIEAQAAYARGELKPMAVEEIMREALK